MGGNTKSGNTQYCSAPNCHNSRAKCPELSFFRLPKEMERNRKWVENSCRIDLHNKDAIILYRNYVFCGDHFENSQFMNAQTRNRLVWNAVPTLFGGATCPPFQATNRMAGKEESHMPTRPNSEANNGCPEGTVGSTQRPVENIDVPSVQREAEDSKPGLSAIAPNPQQVNRMRQLINKQRIKLWRLNKRVKLLKGQVKSNRKDCEVEMIIRTASKYITGTSLSLLSNQLRMGSKKKKSARWTRDDKMFTLALYRQSPEAYRFCGTVLGLPSVRTLQRWLKLFKLQQPSFEGHVGLQNSIRNDHTIT